MFSNFWETDMRTGYMGCLLKRLPDIWEILGRARKKLGTIQLFVFACETYETNPGNARIRKNNVFVMDFAPHNIKIDAEVGELDQFPCSLAPAKTG